MNGAAARFLKIAASSAGLVILGFILTGHATKPVPHGMSLPTDWSHQHVIFTRPRSAEMARRFGDDPRYLQQMYRQDQVLKLASPVADARLFSLSPLALRARGLETKKSEGLWSEELGTLSGSSLGAQNYPAKYTFDTTVANCAGVGTPDYVVYSTGITGSLTQASVVAYDNLYTGCTGTVPTVFWAYNTGGQVLTSPVLSENGDQVAFVETNGVAGILVMLKWKAGTGTVGTPVTLVPVLAANYATCAAPCMTEVLLADSSLVPTNDTTSSIFYDYSSDTGWVGGAGGWLHKITGLFHGAPTELNNGTFPLQLNSTTGVSLSSPVYDQVSGTVFVGDSGGFLYHVDPILGEPVQSAQVDHGVGLVEGPLIDAFDGLVYVFSSSDGSTRCNAGTSPCTAVYQFNADFVADATGNEVTVGQSSATPNPMYLGAFDTQYIKSEGPPTGNLYVCGNTGANPTLYQIPVLNGDLPAAGSVITQLAPGTSTTACSPVSDIQNTELPGGTQERLFVSPQNNGRPAVCAADTGCLTNLLDTPWRPGVHWGQGQELLSTNLRIMVVITPGGGKTGTVQPTWTNTQAGTTIVDNEVTWLDQGHLTAVQPGAWVANHAYTVHQRILDTNNVIEVVTTAGTSSGTEPDWSPDKNAGDTTTDGTVTWTNAGDNPVAALPVTGGTTGVILDNTANEGSQVYFGTLANQGTDSGVIGTSCPSGAACAVQASQTALK
jgi:hypothetical protein